MKIKIKEKQARNFPIRKLYPKEISIEKEKMQKETI